MPLTFPVRMRRLLCAVFGVETLIAGFHPISRLADLQRASQMHQVCPLQAWEFQGLALFRPVSRHAWSMLRSVVRDLIIAIDPACG